MHVHVPWLVVYIRNPNRVNRDILNEAVSVKQVFMKIISSKLSNFWQVYTLVYTYRQSYHFCTVYK